MAKKEVKVNTEMVDVRKTAEASQKEFKRNKRN
jgi:hypothetical protein